MCIVIKFNLIPPSTIFETFQAKNLATTLELTNTGSYVFMYVGLQLTTLKNLYSPTLHCRYKQLITNWNSDREIALTFAVRWQLNYLL